MLQVSLVFPQFRFTHLKSIDLGLILVHMSPLHGIAVPPSKKFKFPALITSCTAQVIVQSTSGCDLISAFLAGHVDLRLRSPVWRHIQSGCSGVWTFGVSSDSQDWQDLLATSSVSQLYRPASKSFSVSM